MNFIKKDDFVEIINELKMVDEYQCKLNRFFSNNGVDGFIYQPDCSCATLKLLHIIWGEKDRDEWINSFCFDYDFGRKYKGELKDKAGNVIPFSTAEDLYNFLMSDEN